VCHNLDLPDLVPFLKALFAVMGKRPTQEDDVRLSFKTPQQWMDDFTMAERYDLLFAREPRPREGEDVAGIGLRVVDRAIKTAIDLPEVLAAVGELTAPLVVFALRDRITGSEGAVRTVIVGLQQREGGEWGLLRDWEMIKLLNPIADKPRSQALGAGPMMEQEITTLLTDARNHLETHIQALYLPFRLPAVDNLACLIPGKLHE
jgi:hypothetical protein